MKPKRFKKVVDWYLDNDKAQLSFLGAWYTICFIIISFLGLLPEVTKNMLLLMNFFMIIFPVLILFICGSLSLIKINVYYEEIK